MLERYFKGSYVGDPGSDTIGRSGLFSLWIIEFGGGCVIESYSSVVVLGQFLFFFELFQFIVNAVGGRFTGACGERFVGGGVL